MCRSIHLRIGYDAIVSTSARKAGPTSPLAPLSPAMITIADAMLTRTMSERGSTRTAGGASGGTSAGDEDT